MFSSVTCWALEYFCTLSHERHGFRKKKNVNERKMEVLILSTALSQTLLILRRTGRGMTKTVYCVGSMQIARYFCQILMSTEFSWYIFIK